jgi:hypothetical protein
LIGLRKKEKISDGEMKGTGKLFHVKDIFFVPLYRLQFLCDGDLLLAFLTIKDKC